MNKRFSISTVIAFLFAPLLLLAQSRHNTVIKGYITDENGHPLSYVNIGILRESVGTVSDAKGLFTLKVDQSFEGDSVQFSSIGYHSQTFSLKHLKGLNSPLHHIVLISSFTALPEVIVTPKQCKTRVLGNVTRSKLMSGGFSSNDLGAEAGTRIKIARDLTYLEKVSFHLSYNKLDSIKVRLNIYALKNGKPDHNILPENVILQLRNKQVGKIEVDLSKYDLVVKDDILVALQLIEGKGDFRSSVFISASVLGTPTYYREASHAVWKVYKGLSIGMNVTVRQCEN
jgi:hypothetical protein